MTDSLLEETTNGGNTYSRLSVTPSNGYTLNTDFGHAFELVYKRNVYAITLPNPDNGTVEITDGATGLAGSAKTVTITPHTGYCVSDVKIDGTSVGAVTSYTFNSLDANHEIEVVFIEDDPIPDTGLSPFTLPAALALYSLTMILGLTLGKKTRTRKTAGNK